MENQFLHEVAITAIIYQDNKYLIIQRSPHKKRFPGLWTVPGGKLETNDYTSLPKETKDYWYNVLERTLRREVHEEVGIDITDIDYLTSLATVHGDGNPSLVLSCLAKYESGDILLQKEEASAFAWVTLEEAKNYSLLDGILDEFMLAERKRNGEKNPTWQRYN